MHKNIHELNESFSVAQSLGVWNIGCHCVFVIIIDSLGANNKNLSLNVKLFCQICHL